MQSQFESYLNDVSVRLRSLPAEERTNELQEAQQHLEALAAARREIGESDAEAQQNALRQFGEAAKVASQITQTHRRRLWRQRLDRPILAFAFVAGALAIAMPILGSGYFPDIWHLFGISLPRNASEAQIVLYVATEPKLWLYGAGMGLLLNRFAPRSSARSILPGYLLLLIGIYLWQGTLFPDTWAHTTHRFELFMNMLEMAVIFAAPTLAALLVMRTARKRALPAT